MHMPWGAHSDEPKLMLNLGISVSRC